MALQVIKTVEQLDALNSDLMVDGYRAGFANEPNYTQKDQGYWHGFLNGQVDGKHMLISPEQCELARVVVASQREN